MIFLSSLGQNFKVLHFCSSTVLMPSGVVLIPSSFALIPENHRENYTSSALLRSGTVILFGLFFFSHFSL